MFAHPTTVADTAHIPPARFAEAITELSLPTLQLKLLEIRNSISHLRTSNIQLLPFAMGTEAAVGDEPGVPDETCAEAIRENDAVIERMEERVSMIRSEVEGRGFGWQDFEHIKRDESPCEPDENDVRRANGTNGVGVNVLEAARQEEERHASGQAPQGSSHPAWSDGTFQTGVIRGGIIQYDEVAGQREPQGAGPSSNGTAPSTSAAAPSAASATPTGGSLSDDQLRQALEERVGSQDDDGKPNNLGGVFL